MLCVRALLPPSLGRVLPLLVSAAEPDTGVFAITFDLCPLRRGNQMTKVAGLFTRAPLSWLDKVDCHKPCVFTLQDLTVLNETAEHSEIA